MKILVTGCNGFIGSHVCEYYLKYRKDVTIIGIDNNNDYYDVKQKEANLNILKNYENFIYICEDIIDSNCISIHKPNIIIHLAGMAGVRYSIQNPKLYIDINLKGSIHLFEECVKNKINRFVYASSSSVYGLNESIPFSETDDINKCNSHYSLSKYCLELYANLYNKLYNINVIGLRFFTVYGPRGRPDMAPFKFLNKILNEQPIDKYGDGTSLRDYTYIDDIVNGVVSAADQSDVLKNEVINLGNNKIVSLNQFIETCENVCNKKAIINQKDNQVGDIPITYSNNNKAKQLLNYKPMVNLQEGLTHLKNWLVEK